MISADFKYYEDERTSYYQQLTYPTSFQNFTDIIKRTSYGSSAYSSQVPIKFKTLDFGEKQESIVKKLGKPRFVYENNAFSPTVYFYKETLLNHRLLIQLHFFEGKFVLATQSVIDTDFKWRQFVKVVILEKYKGSNEPIVTLKNNVSEIDKNLIFTDGDNNTIFLMESINLNIIYSSGDPGHLQMIEEYNDLKLKKINDEENDLKAILKSAF